MNKWFKYFLIAIVFAGIILYFTKSCSLYQERSIWKGRAIEAEKKLDNTEKRLDEVKKEAEKVIRENEKIKQEANQKAEKSQAEILELKKGTRSVKEIESKNLSLKEENKELKIEIKKRDEIIQKLEFTISKKDEAYFALDKQYQASLNIIAEFEGFKIEFENTLRTKNQQIRSLERSFKGTRFLQRTETVVIVILIGAVAYGLIV